MAPPRRRAVFLSRRPHGLLLAAHRRPDRLSTRSSSAAARPTASARASTAAWCSRSPGPSSRSLITMVIFVWGASVFFAMSRPPAETLNIYVVGKQWMWKFQHLERPARDQRAARAGRPAGEADHDVRGRHPRPLRPGVPRQGRRHSRPLHAASGSSRRSPAAITCSAPSTAARSHSGMIGQVVVHGAERVPGLAERRRGRKARSRRRARSCSPISPATPATAPTRRAAGRCSTACSARPSRSQAGEHGRRRRGLPPRVDPQPEREDHGRLPADHADVPGPGDRGGAARADRVRQVAADRAAGARGAAQARSRRRRGRATGDHAVTVLLPPRHYLNDGYGVSSWLLTRDHKRIALLYLAARHALLLHRRRVRRADPPRAGDAGRRPGHRRHLQQAVHACTA